jgi:dihydropteroate synthase
MNGANILRVHDVKEAREAIKLYEAVSAGSQPD